MLAHSSALDLFSADPDTLSSLNHARKHWVPRGGGNKPISTATMYRWANRGVSGVRLPVLRTPGGVLTSQAAVQHFLREVDAVRAAQHEQSSAHAGASDHDLKAAGLLGGAQ